MIPTLQLGQFGLRQPTPAAAGGADMAFDPAREDVNTVTLSGDDRIVTHTIGGTGYGCAPGLGAKTSGKWYTEFVVGVGCTGGNSAFGVCTSTMNATTVTYMGDGADNSWAYWGNGYYFSDDFQAASASFNEGDVIGVAYDATADDLWFAVNNTWLESADPGAGTGAIYTSVAGTITPCADAYGATASISIRKASEFSYSPPTGFSAWTA